MKYANKGANKKKDLTVRTREQGKEYIKPSPERHFVNAKAYGKTPEEMHDEK